MKCWELKSNGYRTARRATGVGVGSGEGVFVCDVLCLRASDRV